MGQSLQEAFAFGIFLGATFGTCLGVGIMQIFWRAFPGKPCCGDSNYSEYKKCSVCARLCCYNCSNDGPDGIICRKCQKGLI